MTVLRKRELNVFF
jgi:hypothetical protein